MLYLVDASVIITAHNTYYGLSRVPEFWDWLRHNGEEGNIKLPKDIYEEVENGNDELADWMSEEENKTALQLVESHDPTHLQIILEQYGDNLSEDDLILMGKDPFLIAAALFEVDQRIVVTSEVHKRSVRGARRHIPNICEDVGVKWINPVQLLSDLNFSTSWNS